MTADQAAEVSYLRAIRALDAAELPFLVGGTHALSHYTGIARNSKDFDIFVARADVEPVMTVLQRAGFTTELKFPHWLGKATCSSGFLDVIFSSGNGIATVDAQWFEHAAAGLAFGVPVKLCPAEEMIWSKAFIMERERYDGADVLHLVRALAETLDWQRLLGRFGPHWRVLFSHLCLFGFVYPSERDRIPSRVMNGLVERLDREMHAAAPTERVVHGTLVSREQYLVDVEHWGYRDARLQDSAMTPDDIVHWTRAIADEK
jgi:hypothetical protein